MTSICLKYGEGFLRATTRAKVDTNHEMKKKKNLQLWVCIFSFKESNCDKLNKAFKQRSAIQFFFTRSKIIRVSMHDLVLCFQSEFPEEP